MSASEQTQREAAIVDPRGLHDGLGPTSIATFFDHTYAGCAYPMLLGNEPSYVRREEIAGCFHVAEWREDWRGRRFAAVLDNEEGEERQRWIVFDLDALQEIER